MSGRERIITTRESSRLLDVSEATVRNWVRHGYLSPLEDTTGAFYYKEVLSVKRQLASGKINRLNQRANRTRLGRTMIPAEYVGDAALTKQAEKIRDIMITRRLGIEQTMFCLTVRWLVLKKEVRLDDPARIFQARAYSGWRRSSIKSEMLDWLKAGRISSSKRGEKYLDLYHGLESTTGDDILGLLYQSLRREGSRSRQGMYYTPSQLLSGVIDNRSRISGCFLDPCCGTGRFLTCAARSGCYSPEALVGVDNDPVAVRLARINLLLTLRKENFTPQIFCLDVLDPDKTRVFQKRFDLIATNPPWGATFSPAQRKRLKQAFPFISSGESFSFFLAAGLALLSAGGRLSYILPESFLNVRIHQDIRQYLLRSSTLETVTFMGRRFGGVLSSVIRIDVKKTTPSTKATTRIAVQNGRGHRVPQGRFQQNEGFIIDAGTTEAQALVIKKIYDFPHATLAGAADWALGIVTGDNRQHLSDIRRKGMEPVFRGKDIQKFRLRAPEVFIRFSPERFQQTAPEAIYRVREKLIYRFVSRRLIFALDGSGVLTLNSANILIPKIEGYPLKAVLGVLNSSVSQFVFEKKFHPLKVLRKDLEALPLPLLGSKRLQALEHLVDRAIAGENVDTAIDDLIMTGLGLSEQEKQMVFETAV